MLIHTLWAWRKNEDGPDLLEAWAEYDVDQNWDGWQEACQRALTAIAPDMSSLGFRYVDISVNAEAIEEMFYANEIKGGVLEGAAPE